MLHSIKHNGNLVNNKQEMFALFLNYYVEIFNRPNVQQIFISHERMTTIIDIPEISGKDVFAAIKKIKKTLRFGNWLCPQLLKPVIEYFMPILMDCTTTSSDKAFI